MIRSFLSQKKKLYAWNMKKGETRQLTNIQNANNEKKEEKLSPEDKWLKNEQVQYLEVLRERLNEKKLANDYDSATAIEDLRKINIGDETVRDLSISPDGRYISYRLYKAADKRSPTIVPN